MKLANRFAAVSVQPLGAMLHDCIFHLGNGRHVRPLYDAPWRGDRGAEFEAQPPIIQGLGSEWPCVPFGRLAGDMALPGDWMPAEVDAWDDCAHGYSSNNGWSLHKIDDSGLIARIDYPEDKPVHRLERHVRLMEDRPGIALSLTVEARRAVAFPLGLHPVLSMEGASTGVMRLEVSDTARAWSFPVDVEPGRGHFAPNQQDRPLEDMRDRDGNGIDIRKLPPDGRTEDLLLLTGTGGSVGLLNPVQKCRTTIEWDPAQLPGCAIWISNGGRDYYPWNSRVAALGVEPVAAAFDLGIAYGLSQATPLARRGVATAISVTPEQPLHCDYRILVDPC